MIKNILFDLDDTILDFKKSERSALTKTLVWLDVEPSDENITTYSRINAEQWKLLELGKLTRDEVRLRRYSLFFEAIGVDRDARAAGEYYENKLSVECFFIDGALQTLNDLYSQYRLYIVSNGNSHVQYGRIKCADIGKYFDGIFISHEIGYAKPSVEFFSYCFDNIEDFKREETIIVGDSLSSDVKGGKNAGITTVWYNPTGANASDVIPDHEIKRITDLPYLIKKL